MKSAHQLTGKKPIKFTLSAGFTLIELLVVITIIAALAVSVFVALNPAQRLKDARDSRRVTDLDTILSAVHEYVVDNKGSYPVGLSAGMLETQLGTGLAAACSPLSSGGCNVAASTACVDLSGQLTKYLKSIPIDPLGGVTWTAAKTGYSIIVDANGIVTLRACGTGTGTTEGANNLSTSR